MTSETGTCPTCDRPLDRHDRNIRFRLPDPVQETIEQEKAPGAWMSHVDAQTSVMMQIPGVGPFLRALIPVALTGGHTVTFGVWLLVDPDDLQLAARIWQTPQYTDFAVEGWLANSLPGWGLLGKPVKAAVRKREHTPYCVDSSDPVLAAVLTQEWRHDPVLDALEVHGI
ncbi:MAG TPA: DUF2199 domain-containing protein [Mycobacteriales bacterium]|nr:DUF2199 domain-containing protein [Mycobacteriales bacterium]